MDIKKGGPEIDTGFNMDTANDGGVSSKENWVENTRNIVKKNIETGLVIVR